MPPGATLVCSQRDAMCVHDFEKDVFALPVTPDAALDLYQAWYARPASARGDGELNLDDTTTLTIEAWSPAEAAWLSECGAVPPGTRSVVVAARRTR